jgi:hypothetical protein
MPYARSTYDPNGGLRTETEAPDSSLINLGRELINDRRSDYQERRAKRGTERNYTSPPQYRNPPSGSAGPNILGGAAPRGPADWSNQGPPLLPISAMWQGTGGPGYSMDVLHMTPAQRQAFLPGNSAMPNDVRASGLDNADPGWLQFLALTDRRRAVDEAGRRGSL